MLDKPQEPNNKKNTTDNCYLEYDERGYLICSYNHKAGEDCLMKDKNY